MSALLASRIHAVVGASQRLRDELLPTLTADWRGPVKRVADPPDPQRLILDLETASLFEEPALWLVRAGAAYVKKHQALFAPLAGKAATAGTIILLLSELDGRIELAKSLVKAKTLHQAAVPDERALVDWLCPRLMQYQQGVDQPRQVAEALAEHFGADIDALLGGLEATATYCGSERITVKAVDAVCGATASRPIWDFVGAFCDGNARRATELLYAGEGIEPNQALGALTNELRKILACAESANDAEACAMAGLKGRTQNLYYTRNRARNFGRQTWLRLFSGALWAQRQLRQAGHDQEFVLEQLVLHAQKLVKAAAR